MNKKDMIDDIKTVLKAKLGKNVPIIVAWAITNRCNFRCRYCTVHEQKSKELDTALVLDTIDKLKTLGTRIIGFSGGEPLLRDDIGKLISHCRKKRIYSSITTNGWLLDKKAQDINDADEIIISFDGPCSHDKNRREGSYQKIMSFLDKTINKKITLNTVITRDNVSDIDNIIEMTKKYGVWCSFQPVYHQMIKNKHIDQLKLSSEQLTGCIDKLIRYKKNNAKIKHSIPTLKRLKQSPANKKKCYAGKVTITIDADGKIYPCYDLIKKFRASDITELEDAISLFKSFRCDGCDCNVYTEINNLFGFRPASLHDHFKFLR